MYYSYPHVPLPLYISLAIHHTPLLSPLHHYPFIIHLVPTLSLPTTLPLTTIYSYSYSYIFHSPAFCSFIYPRTSPLPFCTPPPSLRAATHHDAPRGQNTKINYTRPMLVVLARCSCHVITEFIALVVLTSSSSSLVPLTLGATTPSHPHPTITSPLLCRSGFSTTSTTFIHLRLAESP